MTLTLTDTQEQAIYKASQTARGNGPAVYKIGGAAGTGKSTIFSEILKEDPCAMVCAYTGQAANELRKRGCLHAGTIHSQIYRWEENEEKFVKRRLCELTGDYFLVDEASMIGAEIYADMQSYGLPIIAVGDHHQLPPVSKSDINLMEEPDIVLEQVHRQEQGSPIIELATWIRTSYEPGIEWPKFDDPRVRYFRRGQQGETLPDIAVVGFNKVRVQLNGTIRQALGRARAYSPELGAVPFAPGERIVCLRNDQALGVYNGMTGTVLAASMPNGRSEVLLDAGESGEAVAAYIYEALVLWDGFPQAQAIRLSDVSINKEQTPAYGDTRLHRSYAAIVDYGYAATCHKVQGSQFQNVAVFVQLSSLWDARRWLYTAVTRAIDSVGLYF